MQKQQGINFCFISDKYVIIVLFDEFNISFTLMALLIYIYQIKVNGFRFPVQVSSFHSGCVSFKYGPPLCWSTLRILSKMVNIGMCDVCFHGFHVILIGYMVKVGNRGKKKDTGKVDYNRRQTRVGVE